jgi:O-antigen/teichoic acid export membrane protein
MRFGACPAVGDDCAVSTDPAGQAPAAATAGTSAAGISVQGTAIVGAGLVVSQVIAMLQMLVVSRLLGPEQFGAFGALAVILLLGSTAMAATQVVIARHVASGRSSEHIGAGSVLLVGALTCALTVVLSPLLSNALNLSDVMAVVVVGATFIPFTVTGAQLGLLQGAERHKRLGALYVVATGARVAGAVVGAAIGGTADSTLVGLAIGATLGAVVGQFLLVGQPPWGSSEEGPRDFLVEVGHAAHALIALYALTNLDVLLARAQLPAYDAGLYTAGALIARAVFFLPQAVLVAAFPRMVAGSRNAQKQAIMAVAGLGLLATLVVAAAPRLIVRIMSGTQYLVVAQDAWIFALAGAGFGVVQVLLYARMAHHDRRATLLLWGGVAALAALGLTLGTSIHALATVAASVAWTVALAGLVWARTSPPPLQGADEPIVSAPA